MDGDYDTIVAIAHELAHRFTAYNGEPYNGKEFFRNETAFYKEDNGKIFPSFVNDVLGFSESVAMYAEMLCADYLEGRYNAKDYNQFQRDFRLSSYVDIEGKIEQRKQEGKEKSDIDEFRSIIESIDEKDISSEDINKVRSFIEASLHRKRMASNPKLFCKAFCGIEYDEHITGYILATYIYEKAKNKSQNPAEIFNKCLNAEALGRADDGVLEDEQQDIAEKDKTQIQIELLEELGIPIIKNGQIVLDDEAIEDITGTFMQAVDQRQNSMEKTTNEQVVTPRDIVEKDMEEKITNSDIIEAQKNITEAVKTLEGKNQEDMEGRE